MDLYLDAHFYPTFFIVHVCAYRVCDPCYAEMPPLVVFGDSDDYNDDSI